MAIIKVYAKSIYWHMIDSSKDPSHRSPIEGYSAPNGKLIRAGDLLGYADSTGLSTADHLHFGLKPCLPGEPVGTWANVAQNNGYQGAIDPVPYFNGKSATDVNSHDSPFTIDLQMGDASQEVARMQKKLQRIGYFPETTPCTGFYGSITRSSVFAFQKDYIPNLTWTEKFIYYGRYFGQKTRAAFNRL